MNTTVHELGHFLGLGHTADGADTMYPRADTGEIKKRTLTCNDAQGLVFKYPADATVDSALPEGAERNGYCNPPSADCGYCAPPRELDKIPTIEVVSVSDGNLEGGGCQSSTPGSLVFLLMGLGYFTLRRRRAV